MLGNFFSAELLKITNST